MKKIKKQLKSLKTKKVLLLLTNKKNLTMIKQKTQKLMRLTISKTKMTLKKNTAEKVALLDTETPTHLKT